MRLAVAGRHSDDKNKWKIRAWDTRADQPPREFQTSRVIVDFAWARDAGHVIVACADDIVLKWEVTSDTRTEIRGWEAGSLSTDGTVRTSRSGTVLHLWDTETGRPLNTLVSLRDSQWLAVNPEGEIIHGSPGIDDAIVYVVESDEGQQTLTPVQFAKTYGGGHH